MTSKLGIVAGGGQLPLLLAEACVTENRDYLIVGLESFADETAISGHPHEWNALGRVGELYALLKKHGCTDVVMAGRVTRPDFGKLKLDAKGTLLLPKVMQSALRGDDNLFKVLVGAMEAEGFNVVGADDILSTLLTPSGPLTNQKPSEDDWSDIERAREVLNTMGSLDIGQATVVCRSLVLAVEAVEGTDQMLARCISLPEDVRGTPAARKGVLVKLPKPGQERRVDLPTVGLETVLKAAKAGLAGLALAEGASFVLDRAEVVKKANEKGMFVCGI